MGVAQSVNWIDAACWDGKAFDGGWNTRLAETQDVLEPATGRALWRTGVASATDMQAASACGDSRPARFTILTTPGRFASTSSTISGDTFSVPK